LPKLVIVTEGDHHLVAIDLTSGEPRWRWSWGGSSALRGRAGGSRGTPRMKRAGRLVYFTCGDGALTALDVMTGAIVWRVRDRLRFRAPPSVAHDALFAVAGGTHGAARLYRIDPYSGHVRWSRLVDADAEGAAPAPCTIEGPPLVGTESVAVAVRSARASRLAKHAVPRGEDAPWARTSGGVVLVTFSREDGAPLAHSHGNPRARTGGGGTPPGNGTGPGVLAPNGTSWLAVDDAFIGNAPTGEIVSVDARGALRWRIQQGMRPLEADVPRRLEPILRSGALFVPHSSGSVMMLSPKGGDVLGSIDPAQAGAIPDLLRVDERADVYIAEESGHLTAFGALPRLRLV
jgi:outer membrane protein assembly factor BamB